MHNKRSKLELSMRVDACVASRRSPAHHTKRYQVDRQKRQHHSQPVQTSMGCCVSQPRKERCTGAIRHRDHCSHVCASAARRDHDCCENDFARTLRRARRLLSHVLGVSITGRNKENKKAGRACTSRTPGAFQLPPNGTFALISHGGRENQVERR